LQSRLMRSGGAAAYVFGAFATIVMTGCQLKLYRFEFPREARVASSTFTASTPLTLAHSPAPEIALYNVAGEDGRARPAVVCYVPTHFEVAIDVSGPKIWKHEIHDRIEYEIVSAPAIEREKYRALQGAISASLGGVDATLVPCELVINSMEVPGTLNGVRVDVSSFFNTAGDLFWVVHLYARKTLSEQIEDLMKSPTGLLVPTRATVQGINQPVAPPLEIKGSVLARVH
jgi:hypothetical protein